jgi:hypothetical protein
MRSSDPEGLLKPWASHVCHTALHAMRTLHLKVERLCCTVGVPGTDLSDNYWSSIDPTTPAVSRVNKPQSGDQ